MGALQGIPPPDYDGLLQLVGGKAKLAEHILDIIRDMSSQGKPTPRFPYSRNSVRKQEHLTGDDWYEAHPLESRKGPARGIGPTWYDFNREFGGPRNQYNLTGGPISKYHSIGKKLGFEDMQDPCFDSGDIIEYLRQNKRMK